MRATSEAEARVLKWGGTAASRCCAPSHPAGGHPAHPQVQEARVVLHAPQDGQQYQVVELFQAGRQWGPFPSVAVIFCCTRRLHRLSRRTCRARRHHCRGGVEQVGEKVQGAPVTGSGDGDGGGRAPRTLKGPLGLACCAARAGAGTLIVPRRRCLHRKPARAGPLTRAPPRLPHLSAASDLVATVM